MKNLKENISNTIFLKFADIIFFLTLQTIIYICMHLIYFLYCSRDSQSPVVLFHILMQKFQFLPVFEVELCLAAENILDTILLQHLAHNKHVHKLSVFVLKAFNLLPEGEEMFLVELHQLCEHLGLSLSVLLLNSECLQYFVLDWCDSDILQLLGHFRIIDFQIRFAFTEHPHYALLELFSRETEQELGQKHQVVSGDIL